MGNGKLWSKVEDRKSALESSSRCSQKQRNQGKYKFGSEVEGHKSALENSSG